MALPFSEWSREAKDEFAQKRMEEMKLKNEALKQRYAEVEQDRIKAEAKDSSVTTFKVSKKENIVIEKEQIEDIPKVTKEREWDKGKIDQDADDWSPPKFHGYRSRAQRRNFPDRRAPKKEENWRVRSANASKDRQSYSKYRSSAPNHKYQESNNYGTSGFRNENAGFSRQRGRALRNSGGTYRSFQNSRLDEPKKKSISGGAGSASPSLSDSEKEPVKPQPKPEMDRMWQDGGITEVQHKQSRVEKWVKAINTASSWNEEFDNGKGNDYYPEKRGEAGPRDAVKSYGYSNEDGYSKRSQSSRDQTYPKNRERYDGLKYGQSSRGNMRARGSRTPTGERTVGGFENKNQRDFRKRNYSDKNRFRRESDLSDRTSSMKESDYHDCNKDKFNKTTSDSKSSDYSGRWEDEECDIKYASEKRSFDKQPAPNDFGKDKFNKPKNAWTSSVSSAQDGIKKDNLDDEYARNMHQKFPNSYVKDKSKAKNLRNTDHGGFSEQQVDNRTGARKVDYSFSKVKSNKYKTESKFLGNSGKFENESATDNHARASRKYKMSKPSPKRTLSNPVKSLDTSSSASKTMEFNSPDEDVWGDYEDSGLTWNIDGNNESRAEHKSDPWEEADVSKTSRPLKSSTAVEHESNPWEEEADVNTSRPLKSSTAVEHESNPWEEEVDVNTSRSLKSSSAVEHESNPWEEEADVNTSRSLKSSSAVEHESNPWEEEADFKKATQLLESSTAAEHKSNPWEEEDGVIKEFQPVEFSSPVKTDCDTNSEKILFQNAENDGVGFDKVPEDYDNNVVEGSLEISTTNENFAVVIDDQKLQPSDVVDEQDGGNIASIACLNESIKIKKYEAEIDGSHVTGDKHENSNENVEYSGDQNKMEIKIQPSISIADESLLEVFASEVQNENVQSTETEQTSSNLPDNTNPKHSDLEVVQKKISANDTSLKNANSESPSKQNAENDKAEIVHSKIEDSSSQSVDVTCTNNDSESALKSSDHVASKPQSPKREGNENNSGALNLSDDGGWSTVSEDENNVSDDDKNQDVTSASKSEAVA